MESANRPAKSSFRHPLLLWLFVCSFFFFHLGRPCTAADQTTIDFIKARCRVTRYPRLCFETLSIYAEKIQHNPRRLAHTALSLITTRARSTSTFMSRVLRHEKPPPPSAMRDCVENVEDCVYQLRRALREMGHLKGSERGMRIGNIQTWASAALTNYGTCMDGLTENEIERELRDRVRGRINGDLQLASNALALFNSFARELAP